MSEGILPASFFLPEDRCGFHVDERRKKIWGIELDILLKFDSVCKNHGLRYFLAYGTLLGAVRHEGYIPWDDDIDIMMFRKDFETLLHLSTEFADPYFLQTPHTDRESCFSFAKIRNSNSSMIHKKFISKNFNMGGEIDIFPLDNYEPIGAEERFNEIKRLNMLNSAWMKADGPCAINKNYKQVQDRAEDSPIDRYEKIQALAQYCKDDRSEYCAQLSCTLSPLSRRVYKRDWFIDCISHPFELFEFPIPKGWDEILSTTFPGDYREYPPESQRGNWHSDIVFQPDRPYSEVVGELRERYSPEQQDC